MEIKFNLLKDEPISPNKSGYFNFYHSYFTPALKEILTNETSVHTIGLFGGWGTGKSTIIDSLKNDLVFPIFVFDAWKYQEDSLRRTFLLRLIEFIDIEQKKGDIKVNTDKFNKIREQINSKLYNGKEKKCSVAEKDNKTFKEKIKEYKNILLVVLFLIVTLGIVYLWEKYLGLNEVVAKILNYFAGFSLLSTIITFVYLPIVANFFKNLSDKITKTILPITTLRETIEREERLNSPEQFEDLFSQIVESVEISQKMVIVFDNIDRVQGDIAIKILSTIKTFLDPVKNKNIVFLVPCDDNAVNAQIKQFYSEHSDDIDFDPSEFLRKLFNLIIYTPDFINNDLEKYTESLIQETGDIKKYIDNEDVKFVINKAFSNNPREIKQFINNFISLILVASKTPVSDKILGENKIGYLAKVLAIKEKYPFAYKRLKNKWNKPEDIVYEKDDRSFIDFMANTSRITVDDAEPFIYFKEPVLSSILNNTESMRQSLIDNNLTEFKKLVNNENNKDSLIDYIILLFDKYKNYQDNILFNIFITQLIVFSELKIKTEKKNYYNKSIEILDNKLWKYYLQIPATILFELLLSSNKSEKKSVKTIIDRYIIAIEGEDFKKPANKDNLIDVLQSILDNSNILDIQQKNKIANAIEQSYSEDIKVIDLYKSYTQQNDFITIKSFEKFITFLRNDNITNLFPIIKRYKKFIVEAPLFDILYQKISEIVQQENVQSPDYREEKTSLFTTIEQIFNLFRDQLDKIDDETKKQQLNILVQSFNSISGYDNRYILVNILKRYENRLQAPEKTNIHTLISNFFQNATFTSIGKVLDYWDISYSPIFISQYIDVLKQRTINDENILNIIYQKSNDEQKNNILSFVIKNRPDHGLQFLSNNDEIIPNKVETIQYLLDKASSIPQPENRLSIYEYINKNLKKNHNVDVKNLAMSQIMSLLKNDNNNSSLAGLQFLQGATFLSDEKKREISKEVINFLKEPSRTINENHNNCINSIVFLFPVMNDTPKNDFVYILFELLRGEKNEATISMALKSINSINTKIGDYNKEYNDLVDRLKSWSNNITKNIIIDNFLSNKPNRLSKEEKKFYDDLEAIKESTAE